MQNTPKPVRARKMVKTTKLSVKPVITELTEKMTMEMRKVLRRPMRSEMTPPRKPPEVMPMKYQNMMVAMSVGLRPQEWDRAGATKPKFQLSNCSKK